MSNTKIELKLDMLIGEQVTIVKKLKKSPVHTHEYAGHSGKLEGYELGDSKGEISANIIVEVTLGKKVKRIEQVSIWIDSRDIVGFES